MTILLIVSLFFIAVLLGVVSIYMGYIAVRTSPMYELRKRLRKLAVISDERLPSDLVRDVLSDMTPLDRLLYKSSWIKRLDKLIDNAGFKIDVKMFILYMIIAALIGFTFGVISGRGMALAVIFLLIGGIAPLFFLRVKASRRITRFTEQFPNALDMMSRSLKAGHSISSAVQMVGTEMAEPIGGLFKTVYEEQTLGLSMKDALSRLAERIQSMDLRLFLTAINIHRDIGGNLSETLERLATTIRERVKLRRQIRVYTAQGRLSGYILAALPIFMALFLYVTSPDYIGELVKAKEGVYATAVVVAGQVIGFLIIRKMINIKI